jgi:hypothetical protein
MVLLLTYLDPRDSLEMRLRRAFQNGFFYYSLNRREVIATQQVRDGGQFTVETVGSCACFFLGQSWLGLGSHFRKRL